MNNKIVISTENTRAVEFLAKLRAKKQEIKATIMKDVLLPKKSSK